jgi:hypothetical protein
MCKKSCCKNIYVYYDMVVLDYTTIFVFWISPSPIFNLPMQIFQKKA